MSDANGLIDLIPSTARSTSSIAAPLPAHLTPLLGPSLEKAKASLTKVLPEVRKISILEEAEYEEDADAGFAKEKMLQSKSFRRTSWLHVEILKAS
jgi:hypothetical protein